MPYHPPFLDMISPFAMPRNATFSFLVTPMYSSLIIMF